MDIIAFPCEGHIFYGHERAQAIFWCIFHLPSALVDCLFLCFCICICQFVFQDKSKSYKCEKHSRPICHPPSLRMQLLFVIKFPQRRWVFPRQRWVSEHITSVLLLWFHWHFKQILNFFRKRCLESPCYCFKKYVSWKKLGLSSEEMASMSRITAQLLQQLPGGSLDVRSDYHRVVIVIVIGIQDNHIFYWSFSHIVISMISQ